MPLTYFSHKEARAYYDRFGQKQDRQSFYEGPAIRTLLQHGRFESAHTVFELGCGTGTFAATLLADYLPEDATYEGVDISATMTALAEQKLADFANRARIMQTDGTFTFNRPDASTDRFVSNYVLDLLAPEDIPMALNEAYRLLAPGGLLCLISLSYGQTLLTRGMTELWERLHHLNPRLVGGCRPLFLRPFLAKNQWQLDHHETISAWGIPSEILVAKRKDFSL